MTRLDYLANIRLPTEKAHGLQIMQNCEAFAQSGLQVTLWAARRRNTAAYAPLTDVWAHYGVQPCFDLRRVPCLDLMPLAAGHTTFTHLAFYLQQFTYTLVLLLRLVFRRADIYYSRDALTLFALSFIKPRARLAYEVHMLGAGRAGQWLQRQVVRRVGTVIPITRKLAEDLSARTGRPLDHFHVAHDGIRRGRFLNMPAQAEARRTIGWPAHAFIVGYVGRLQTMSSDKGVGTLVEALRQLGDVALGLVGGPDDMAAALRQHWLEQGMPADHFLYAGQVAPEQVPLYLAALDVCVIPSPWTPHFAYYTSPMKLFEYMAARRPIIASDLPSTAEVVRHEHTALLFPPSDSTALAAAIQRLRDDPALRTQLADQAYADVMNHYTWESRARMILAAIQRNTP